MAMEQVARVNALARSALNGMYVQLVQIQALCCQHVARQHAYQTGVNPAQTQGQHLVSSQCPRTHRHPKQRT